MQRNRTPSRTSPRAIHRKTPEDRRILVGGKLDAVRHGNRAFALVLTSGETVRGVALGSVEPATLGALLGKVALVSGIAKFRPSGKLLRVEAERVEPAPDDLGVWSTLPRPLELAIDPGDARAAPGAISPLAALFGSLPLEDGEADEELRSAIDGMS